MYDASSSNICHNVYVLFKTERLLFSLRYHQSHTLFHTIAQIVNVLLCFVVFLLNPIKFNLLKSEDYDCDYDVVVTKTSQHK